MKTRQAVVIGSGVAGLATAIRLAKAGFSVQVFEKNSYPGGKLSAIEADGYFFDAGPSLFTQPHLLEELFESCGEALSDYLSYKKIDEACHYFYENGKQLIAYTDKNKFANELQDKLGEDKESLNRYLYEAERVYNNIGEIFLNKSLHKASTWLSASVLKAIGTTKLSYITSTLHQHNAAKFKTAEAVQLFDRYATYNGSDPYKAPGMLHLIPHLEYNEGVFYSSGGMISITNALFSLAKKMGVEFFFGEEVLEIYNNNGVAKGIRTFNRDVMADVVVSNMDVYFTYKFLLKDEKKAVHTLQQQRSSSALVFFWGIKNQFPQLGLHNIFFAKDYRAEFKALFDTKQLYDDPTVYINITAKYDSSHAPAGAENWFVMVNVPENIGQDWDSYIQRARINIIHKLTRMLNTDIEAFIATEQILDPRGIEAKTYSFHGSLYGTSSNTAMAAFLRHPNFTSHIKGLYFCGGSVHPGGGIPLCLQSAKIVAALIND